MMPLFSREAWLRPYTLPFLALFAANGLAFLVFTLPRSIQERRAAAKALELRTQLEARRAEVAAVRTQVQTVRSNIADANRFYTEQVKDCSGVSGIVLQALHGVGRELGVRADRLSTTTPKNLEGVPLAEIEVSMPLAGTYQQSATFLQRLERSEHFLVVESIQMRERGSESGGGTDLSMRLKAYCHAKGPRRRR